MSADGRDPNEMTPFVGVQPTEKMGAVEITKAKKFYSATLKKAGMADVATGNLEYFHPDLEPGALQLPRTLGDIYIWCSHYYQQDEIVAACLDRHVDLIISKMKFEYPDIKNEKERERIFQFYTKMFSGTHFNQQFGKFVHNYMLFGNSAWFCEYDDVRKCWKRFHTMDIRNLILTPIPFTDEYILEWSPITYNDIVADNPQGYDATAIQEYLTDEVKEAIQQGTTLRLDTDPLSGSHIAFLSYKRSDSDAIGIPLMFRVFRLLVTKDRLLRAQQFITQRRMTPINLLSVTEANEGDLDTLREQVSYAMDDPDFVIMSNRAMNWQMLGSQERYLQLREDIAWINDAVITGLNSLRSLITGDGAYGQGHMQAEAASIVYGLYQRQFADFIEDHILRPIAVFNGFRDEEGRYAYPKISFDRMSLSDDDNLRNQLQQLHASGQLATDIFLEVLGISPERNEVLLRKQLTKLGGNLLKDTFYTAVATEMATQISKNPEILERLYKELGLKSPAEAAPAVDGAAPGPSSDLEMDFSGAPEAMAPMPEAMPGGMPEAPVEPGLEAAPGAEPALPEVPLPEAPPPPAE